MFGGSFEPFTAEPGFGGAPRKHLPRTRLRASFAVVWLIACAFSMCRAEVCFSLIAAVATVGDLPIRNFVDVPFVADSREHKCDLAIRHFVDVPPELDTVGAHSLEP